MLRSIFYKEYEYLDNWGDVNSDTTVSLHLANSTWKGDVLHIGIDDVNINLTLEQVEELMPRFEAFIKSAKLDRIHEENKRRMFGGEL